MPNEDYRIKLLLLVIFCIIINSFAQSYNPNNLVSVHYNNTELRKILYEISKQSSTKFVFDDLLVDGKNISCNISELSVKNSLDKILIDTDISFKIFQNRLIVLYNERSEQKNTIIEDANKQYLTKLSPSNGFQPTPFTLPTLVEEREPEYPKQAQDKGFEGVVELNLLVSTEGNVKVAEVKKSSGHLVLNNSALTFAKSLKFNPAKAGGKPIDLWVTRNVVYKIIKPLLIPSDYAKKIKQYKEEAKYLSGEERNKIISEILNIHENITKYRCITPNTYNYNKYIKEIVQSEIYEKWQNFWEDFPLYFIVYHDIILRYPNSNQIPKAIEQLSNFIKEDIVHVRKLVNDKLITRQKSEIYIREIYTFLNENYPQVLTVELKADMDNYLRE